MQFLWKYIDDLVGKGLEWYVITELMIYASASLVPLALPLSILVSSIMTFGNLGENYELVACKSAGISLQKVMLPLITTSIFISVGAFFFSNNILPIANLKMGSLLYDVRQQKPALSIKEGIFYNGIDGYSIKVSKKDPDGKTLHNIMIYDHTLGAGNNKLILAKHASMFMSDDERTLILNLYEGNSYEERENIRNRVNTHPLFRTSFKEETIRFDLSTFKLSRTNEELFKDNYQMLNIKQLRTAEDSLKAQLALRTKEFKNNIRALSNLKDNSESVPAVLKENNFIINFKKEERVKIIETAINLVRSHHSHISYTNEDLDTREKLIIRHQIEWHRKFTLSFACLVLFFIGAPLGAIIRKGGLGLPMVISIVLFIFFHVISITGEKFSREAVLPPYVGMWLASMVLLPIGIFLTSKATTDSTLLDKETYLKFFKNFIKPK